MARVPGPVPETMPTATPEVSPRVSPPVLDVGPVDPRFFGGAVAAATEHLGTTLDEAGDKIFATAQSIQQINNTNTSRDANTSFQLITNDPLNKYLSTEGKAAVDGAQPFLQQFNQTLQQYAAGMKNPVQKMMFQQEAAAYQREVANAVAKHVAASQKQWTLDSIKGQYDQNQNQWRNPLDPTELANHQAAQKKLDHDYAVARGVPDTDPIATDNAFTQNANLLAGQIKGVNVSDPQTALKMLNEHASELRKTNQYDILAAQIMTANRTKGTARIASAVFDAQTPIDVQIRNGEAMMTDQDRSDPQYRVELDRAIRSMNATQRYLNNQEEKDAENQLQNAIIAGKGHVRTLDQLESNNPKLKEMLDAHINLKFRASAMINNYNAALLKPRQIDDFHTLLGLAHTDLGKFMDTPPETWNVSEPDYKTLMNERQRILSKLDDPRPEKAMKWMRDAGRLPSNLYSHSVAVTNGVEDQYNQLVGAAQSAYEAFETDKKRPPTQDEWLKQIAPALLNDVVIKRPYDTYFGHIFGKGAGRTEPAYVGIDEITKQDQPKWNQDHPEEPLTEYEYRQLLLRTWFTKLFEAPKAGMPSAAPGTPPP